MLRASAGRLPAAVAPGAPVWPWPSRTPWSSSSPPGWVSFSASSGPTGEGGQPAPDLARPPAPGLWPQLPHGQSGRECQGWSSGLLRTREPLVNRGGGLGPVIPAIRTGFRPQFVGRRPRGEGEGPQSALLGSPTWPGE